VDKQPAIGEGKAGISDRQVMQEQIRAHRRVQTGLLMAGSGGQRACQDQESGAKKEQYEEDSCRATG
jgi:hypothetical protein